MSWANPRHSSSTRWAHRFIGRAQSTLTRYPPSWNWTRNRNIDDWIQGNLQTIFVNIEFFWVEVSYVVGRNKKLAPVRYQEGRLHSLIHP